MIQDPLLSLAVALLGGPERLGRLIDEMPQSVRPPAALQSSRVRLPSERGAGLRREWPSRVPATSSDSQPGNHS